MKKLITLITILSTVSMASIIDLDAQRKILSAKQDLEQISKKSTLTPKLRNRLNKLRDDAIELSEIVYSRKCNSISIHTTPDKTCDNFVKKSKNFIDSYAKWTNSFFASRVSLMKQEKNFRKKVNTCVEMMSAFLNPTMTPEVLFPYELNVDIERRYDTEVTISLTPQYNQEWTFHGNTSGYNRNGEVKYLKKYFMPWTNNCRDIAVNKDGVLEPRYLQAVKDYWADSPYEFHSERYGMATGIYIGFKKPRAYVLEILVNGEVYKEVTIEYALTMSKHKKYRRFPNNPNAKSFMYVDILPKNAIRFQLGGPARHRIIHWDIFIDGERPYTTNGTKFKKITVPEGNVEVRLKN